MKKYHKIPTVYARDPQTNYKTLIEGLFATDELIYLKDNTWVFTEKVDGTNIRIMFDGEFCLLIGGRTDKAQIPPFLKEELVKMFSVEKMRKHFDYPICLYGEGYGAKIQKCGKNYMDGHSFVLFDVWCGERWLKRTDVEDISDKLEIDIVPVIGDGTLYDMVDIAKSGFNSQWGSFIAEGIVARPEMELLDRSGHRIITKIKHKDFPK